MKAIDSQAWAAAYHSESIRFKERGVFKVERRKPGVFKVERPKPGIFKVKRPKPLQYVFYSLGVPCLSKQLLYIRKL